MIPGQLVIRRLHTAENTIIPRLLRVLPRTTSFMAALEDVHPHARYLRPRASVLVTIDLMTTIGADYARSSTSDRRHQLIAVHRPHDDGGAYRLAQGAPLAVEVAVVLGASAPTLVPGNCIDYQPRLRQYCPRLIRLAKRSRLRLARSAMENTSRTGRGTRFALRLHVFTP